MSTLVQRVHRRPSSRDVGRVRAGVVIAIALVLAGAGAAAWWYRPPLPDSLPRAVRVLPDLSTGTAELQRRARQAQRQVASPRHRLEAVAELARLYHENGFLDEARGCWVYLMAAQPTEARWPYYLADLDRLRGEESDLQPLLTRTVELAPEYAPAWLKLADLAFKSRDFETAENHYRRRLALVPGDPYARFGLVRIAQQRGEAETARGLLETVVRECAGFSPAHNLHAELLAAEGRPDEARYERWRGREAGRFREADDPWITELHAACLDPKRLGALGAVEYQTGRGAEALRYFEQALRVAPDDPTNYEVLGSFYLKLGHPERARDTLRKGLDRAEAKAASGALFVELSAAYRALHEPQEALRTAERGLAVVPPGSELHNARGAALSDLKRWPEAVAAYERALAFDPANITATYNRAMALLALERTADARQAFQRCLELQPTYPDALRMLTALALEAGDVAEAGRTVQPLFEGNPGLPDVRQLLGQWHLQAGDAAAGRGESAAAERHYLAGAEVSPEHPGLQVALGTLYLVQGRYAAAVAPLEAYRKSEPSNPQSALYLGQAYARLGRVVEAREVLTAGETLARQQGRAQTAANCRRALEQL